MYYIVSIDNPANELSIGLTFYNSALYMLGLFVKLGARATIVKR